MLGRARLAAWLAAPAIGTSYALAQAKAQSWPSMATPSKDVLPPVRRPSGETDAILNYQKSHVMAVASRRDLEGSDGALEGADWDQQHVLIRDGRRAPKPPTLHGAGFELVADAKEQHCDYYDEEAVTSAYYQQCEELVKRVTGASFVKAFDHNVRCESGRAAGTKLLGGNAVQGPAPIVHGDYTADSAPRRFRWLSFVESKAHVAGAAAHCRAPEPPGACPQRERKPVTGCDPATGFPFSIGCWGSHLR